MVDREQARTLLSRVLSLTDSESEAWLGGGTHNVTRFAQSSITQNVSETDHVVSVRVALGQRTGRATTNRLDEVGLSRCVREAREVARTSAPIEDLLPVPPPASPPATTPREIESYDAKTARMGAAARADVVGRVLELCRTAGTVASGFYQTEEGCFEEYEGPTPLAVSNSAGLFTHHRRTRALFSVTVESPSGGSGWAQGAAHRADAIDPIALARRATQKATASEDPVDVPPGEYTVLLEPEALGNLLSFLCEGLSVAAVEEGRSFLTSMQGERIAGPRITLTDDVHHPLALGVPFDREGVGRRRVVLIDQGVHRGLVSSRASARRHGLEPTGHGLGVPSTLDSLPENLHLAGTHESFDDLVARTDRAILVTRFWYCRLVDRRRVIVTGMTRDGTFLVEGGRITRAVKNLRFNVSVLDVLDRIDALTREQWVGGLVMPGGRAPGFLFTSATTF